MLKKLSVVLAGVVLVAAGCGSAGSSSPASPTSPGGAASAGTTSLSTWGSSAGAPRPSGRDGQKRTGEGKDAKLRAKKRRRQERRNGPAFGDYSRPTRVRGVPGTVTAISTSNSDSYALTSSGTVWAWGHGSEGELGDGTAPTKAVKAVEVDFPPGVRIASLPDPMPYDGGMAIDTAGTVWAWGNDAREQFCQSGPKRLLRPVKVPLPHVSLAAGALLHTIYDSAGTIYSCGEGSNGQLGNGTTGQRATPTRVVGLPSGAVKAVTSSWGNAGVLLADGAYYDWGFNAAGQDGDGNRTLTSTPVHVKLPAAVTQVSQGGSTSANGQTVALLSDGSLWVWGNGRSGQLGDGKTVSSSTPVRLREPTGVDFVKVNSGGATDYAIDRTGQLWAWGGDKKGQIGNGTIKAAQTTPVNDGIVVSQVSSTASDIAGLAR